jgi:hypothetical protein
MIIDKINNLFKIDKKAGKKLVEEKEIYEFKLSDVFSSAKKAIKKKRAKFVKILNSAENNQESVDIIFEYYKQLEKLFVQYSGDPISQLIIKEEMLQMIKEIKSIANLRVDMTDIDPAPKSSELLRNLETDIRSKRNKR